MTSPVRYRAEPAADLIVRPLEDITLIYHRRSGQTHMVMSPVPEILAVLSREDGVDGILTLLSRNYDIGDPAEALEVIAAHLEEMAALGLVHRL